MAIGAQLYEGKAKKVFETAEPDQVVQYFKDDATAFNAQKRGTIVDKGVINNKVSERLFRLLEQGGIPTHFIERLSDRELSLLVDLARSTHVGDSDSDRAAAVAAGLGRFIPAHAFFDWPTP